MTTVSNNAVVAIAASAFAAILFLNLPFPLIVLTAAIAGYFGGRLDLSSFKMGGGHKAGGSPTLSEADSLLGEEAPANACHCRFVSQNPVGLWIVPSLSTWRSPAMSGLKTGT